MRLVSLAGLLLALLTSPLSAMAESLQASELYNQAVGLAASGNEGEASARLKGAAALLPEGDLWKARMNLAASLLDMRRMRRNRFDNVGLSASNVLAAAYLRNRPVPQAESNWIGVTLAVLLPGSGHAWMGRWHDAMTAALLVWPMLLLTLWAAYRRMGPVTLFFALITAWLWSGTVFSVVSLGERTTYEAYLLWWQGLWQASALPGRPW